VFEPVRDPGGPSLAIATGPVMDRAMHGMRRAVAAMAAAGNDLIVDDVMLGRGEADDYRALLAGQEVRFVGLFAPLDVLEARERARGDRLIGLARWQFDRVHAGVAYDLRLDTAVDAPAACAERIKAAFRL
jgi:chloramphenicol 3-O phosphotransferase